MGSLGLWYTFAVASEQLLHKEPPAASALVVISACLTLLSKDTCPFPGKLSHCVARWQGRAAALSVSGTEGLCDESDLAQEGKAEL